MSIRMKHIALSGALLAALAIVFPASAAFNDPDPSELAAKEQEEKLDMTVTEFTRDGSNGRVFEFTPPSLPGIRCVVFKHGNSSGMQCFPRKENSQGQ